MRRKKEPVDPTLEMPALYTATERVSASSQRAFFRVRAAEYAALFVGAVTGELSNDFLAGAGPIIALLCFLLALLLRISQVGDRAEKRWYDARAASESIKSASWQYTVGGESFPIDDRDSKTRYLQQLQEILAALPGLNVGAAASSDVITRDMETVRGSNQHERAQRYRDDRVSDQVRWYAKKARTNRRRSAQWRWTLVGIEAAAIIAGVLQVADLYNFGLLSLFAAAAASVAAWQQSKRYTELSEAYAVTSHEVNMVSASLQAPVSEDNWARSVHDAEAAFSREHTMWLSRRQGPRSSHAH